VAYQIQTPFLDDILLKVISNEKNSFSTNSSEKAYGSTANSIEDLRRLYVY